MTIKVLVCDLDGTLLQPSGGTKVSERVAQALIELQQKGITLILNSGRILHGILPLAQQVQMDRYGGYIIAQNGTMGYDVAAQKIMFSHTIDRDDSLQLWRETVRRGLDFGIAQPSYVVASGFSEGFVLDRDNCEVDYLLTNDPSRYVKEDIWKCAVSMNKEKLDQEYEDLRWIIETQYPYQAIRSTDTIADVIAKGCSKRRGLEELFALTGLEFEQTAAIGDGDSDVEMIESSAYGVTLENGSKRCRQAADLIVPSYESEGCLQLFAYLKNQF